MSTSSAPFSAADRSASISLKEDDVIELAKTFGLTSLLEADSNTKCAFASALLSRIRVSSSTAAAPRTTDSENHQVTKISRALPVLSTTSTVVPKNASLPFVKAETPHHTMLSTLPQHVILLIFEYVKKEVTYYTNISTLLCRFKNESGRRFQLQWRSLKFIVPEHDDYFDQDAEYYPLAIKPLMRMILSQVRQLALVIQINGQNVANTKSIMMLLSPTRRKHMPMLRSLNLKMDIIWQEFVDVIRAHWSDIVHKFCCSNDETLVQETVMHLPHLRSLHLSNYYSDAIHEHVVKNLVNLRSIRPHGDDLTLAQISDLLQVPSLRSLDLHGFPRQENIKEFWQKMSHLDVRVEKLEVNNMPALPVKLSSLRTLVINSMRVLRSLHGISTLSNLSFLKLNFFESRNYDGQRQTECPEGFDELARCPALRRLVLCGCTSSLFHHDSFLNTLRTLITSGQLQYLKFKGGFTAPKITSQVVQRIGLLDPSGNSSLRSLAFFQVEVTPEAYDLIRSIPSLLSLRFVDLEIGHAVYGLQ